MMDMDEIQNNTIVEDNVEEVKTEEVKTEETAADDKKKKWVNPVIAWGAIILECIIVAVIAIIVF